MSSRTRKLERKSHKHDVRDFYVVDGNRTLRRAVRNRRVTNPDKVHELGSVTFIKAPFR